MSTGKSDNSSVYLGPEGTPYAGGELLHNLMLFGRVCKALGMNITPNRMVEVARALEHIQLGIKEDFYYTLRAYLVTHPKEFEYFDEAFNIFWQRPRDDGWTTLDLRSMGEERIDQRKRQFLPPPESIQSSIDDSQPMDPNLIAVTPTYSKQETLRTKDFAEMTVQELEMAKRIIAELPAALGTRRTRRYKVGKGRQLDLRRTLRDSMRNGGNVWDIPTRAPKEKPRPVVLICDISGSMERYTRVLLHFMHTLALSMYQVESFVFSTDLTRITRQIREKSVDDALEEVGQTVKQWGGGTMTGEALHTFNYEWSRRVLGHGTIVILITDGWDRGNVDLLHTEVARLGRLSKRFIWLNPLLDAAEYEPLTRGAQAILPHVHDFLPIRNLANLEVIIKALQSVNGRSTAIPYQKKYTKNNA